MPKTDLITVSEKIVPEVNRSYSLHEFNKNKTINNQLYYVLDVYDLHLYLNSPSVYNEFDYYNIMDDFRIPS